MARSLRLVEVPTSPSSPAGGAGAMSWPPGGTILPAATAGRAGTAGPGFGDMSGNLASLQSPLRSVTASGTRKSAREAGDSVLHHDYAAPRLASRSSRKAAEADVTALVARISYLQEMEDRTRRALDRTRGRAIALEAFRSENGLPPSNPSLAYDPSVVLHAPSALGGPRLYGSRPPTSIREAISPGASFQFRAASPVRAGGVALPPLDSRTMAHSRHLGEVREVAAMLRATQAEAERMQAALAASALRAHKDARLAAAATTRANIEAAARELHDAGVSRSAAARAARMAADEAAATARRLRADAEWTAEEEAAAATAARAAELLALEESLVARIRTTAELTMKHTLTAPLAAGVAMASPGATASSIDYHAARQLRGTPSVLGDRTSSSLAATAPLPLPVASPMRVARTPLAEGVQTRPLTSTSFAASSRIVPGSRGGTIGWTGGPGGGGSPTTSRATSVPPRTRTAGMSKTMGPSVVEF